MARSVFVNLPVVDVARSTAFYEAIGFAKDSRFSNTRASAMTWSDTISVMLLAHDFYQGFIPSKAIADTRRTSAALICLSLETRAEVDAMQAAAVAAGGRALHDIEDSGFMYAGAFEDPDGHAIEPLWMDVEAALAAMAAPAEA